MKGTENELRKFECGYNSMEIDKALIYLPWHLENKRTMSDDTIRN